MKRVRKVICLILAVFMYISPIYVNALSIEDIKNEIKKEKEMKEELSPSNIESKINYDSLKNTDKIVSLLNESLDYSKHTNDLLDEANNLLLQVENDNKKLKNINEKEKYDKSLNVIEENIKKINEKKKDAKENSEKAKERYEEALKKYKELSNLLNEKQLEANVHINKGLDYNKEKLEKLNLLMANINDLETNFKEAFDKSNSDLKKAEKEKNDAKDLFDFKLNEIKEFIELNEEDLNKLIDDNNSYLENAILYEASTIALEEIDKKIRSTEKEIEILNDEAKILEEQFKLYQEKINNEQGNLDSLNKKLDELNKKLEENKNSKSLEEEIKNKTIILDNLIKQNKELNDSKNICSNYLNNLNSAIGEGNYEKVVKLLFENESDFGFVGKNISIKTEQKINSDFKLVDFIVVTDNEIDKEYNYTYEIKDNIVYIYEQELISEKEVDSIDNNIALKGYKAIYNNGSYDIYLEDDIPSINIGNTDYSLKYEDNKWVASTVVMEYNCYWVYCYSKPVTKTRNVKVILDEHYENKKDAMTISSAVATNRCNNVLDNSLDDEIESNENEISMLNEKYENAKKLETEIKNQEQLINNSKNKLDVLTSDLENAKKELKNKDDKTYSDIKDEIKALEDKLNNNPKDDDILNITSIINDINEGNIEISDVIDTINNLDTGIIYKRNIINLINNALKEKYDVSKNELEKVLGEDLESVSNKLKEIETLIEDLVEKDNILIEEKRKNEIAKENLDNVLDNKDELSNVIKEVNNNISKLNEMKENNNLDFLNSLSDKFDEAFENLVDVNDDEIIIEINEFEEKNVINNNVIVNNNQNNIVNNDQNNELENDEDEEENKLEINLKDDAVALDEETDTLGLDAEEESNLGDLATNLRGKVGFLTIPLGLFLLFFIIFKRRKEDEEENC